MRTQLRKWGNSLAIRMPKPCVEALSLRAGMTLEVTVVGRQMILSPVQVEFTLEQLVSRITPENCHGETEWGSAAGAEI